MGCPRGSVNLNYLIPERDDVPGAQRGATHALTVHSRSVRRGEVLQHPHAVPERELRVPA